MTKAENEKYQLIQKLLLKDYVVVQVNTSIKGVELPPHLMAEPSVGLKLSKHFKGPITVDKRSVNATLSFNKSYFNCVLPLKSIWSVTGSENEVSFWPDAAPLEQLNALPKKAETSENPVKDAEDEEAKEKTEPSKKRPVLRRVK